VVLAFIGAKSRATRTITPRVDAVLGDRTPELSDLEHLPFSLQIVRESLRMYPPVWQVLRQTKQVECLGGYEIPAGSQLTISPYVVHRRAGVGTNGTVSTGALQGENIASRSRFDYIPFGGGQRQCLESELHLSRRNSLWRRSPASSNSIRAPLARLRWCWVSHWFPLMGCRCA
jgi:hypothetical protein